MKTVKTSPMGAVMIAVLVTRWNDSKDRQQKESIQKLLSSSGTLDIHEGIKRLAKIADDQFEALSFYWTGDKKIEISFVDRLIGTLLIADYDKRGASASDAEAFASRARGETAHFFASMFKAGYLEQMPMPDFGYHVP